MDKMSSVKCRHTFDEEMQAKGIAGEIEDLNRFNYVLLTRSSPPTNADQEALI